MVHGGGGFGNGDGVCSSEKTARGERKRKGKWKWKASTWNSIFLLSYAQRRTPWRTTHAQTGHAVAEVCHWLATERFQTLKELNPFVTRLTNEL
jgi:hypothetical protein